MTESVMEYTTQIIPTVDGGEYTFTGAVLGRGTSKHDSHINHPPGSYVPKGSRCSGCRWSETAIYYDADAGCYVVLIVGRSEVPGESDRVKVVWTAKPDEVLDALLVGPPKKMIDRGEDPNRLELPTPSFNALEQAAEKDDELDAVMTRWEDEPDPNASSSIRATGGNRSDDEQGR